MKNKFLRIFALFIGLICHAQETPIDLPNEPSDYDPLTAEEISAFTSGAISQVLYNFGETNDNGTVEGSPFTIGFELGKILGYTNSYFMRYDAYNDEMQVRMGEKEVITIDKEKIDTVRFNTGSTFRVLNYAYEGKERRGFLEVLQSNSQVSLLKKTIINFIPAKEAKSSYEPATSATFSKGKSIYFILNEADGTCNEISNRKDILNLYPSYRNDLEKFIKSHKIKFSKEEDLIRLTNYLGTIAL